MSALLFHDGHFLRDDSLLAGAGNRGLRYGDGVFETMKLNLGRIQLGEQHMERLFSGLKLLEFDCPAYFNGPYLLDKITQLATRNNHSRLARIRLMVYRGNGGLYDAENNYPHHILQSWALPEANHHWNENGLVMGIHRKARKSVDILANCKTNNYLPYVLGALEAKQQKWNDAVMLNSNGRVCEATIANLFLVKDNRIITPSLDEGPVAGIMRQHILDKLGSLQMACDQQRITESMLLEADEVFLTNSTYGIRWVGEIDNRRYGNQLTKQLYSEIIQPLFLQGLDRTANQ